MSLGGLTPLTSRRDALDLIAIVFVAAGIDDPRREARLVLLHALQLDLSAFIGDERAPIGAACADVQVLMQRRAAHEPVSRIVGRREFFGLEFHLNANTLDPRPETEHLVEAVLGWARAHDKTQAPLRLLDLGTGTGAILISLLAHLPGASGVGVDLAFDAVVMARTNAARLGVGERVQFQQADLFAHASGQFDVIVSNPPYIPHWELAGLMPEVRKFDPTLALDGGPDGLDFYRRIASEAGIYLVPGGMLALEIGIGQAESVSGFLHVNGFVAARLIPDYAGIARVLCAIWPG